MERVHKANLLVILACVLTMSVTTVMSYGMSTRTIKGCGVMGNADYCNDCPVFTGQ